MNTVRPAAETVSTLARRIPPGSAGEAAVESPEIVKRLLRPGRLLTGEGQRMAGYAAGGGIAIYAEKPPSGDGPPALITVVISSAHENSQPARNAVGAARKIYPRSRTDVFVASPDFLRRVYDGSIFRDRGRTVVRGNDASQIEGRVLTWIADAAMQGASDLHFWAEEGAAALEYRIDGLLERKTALDPEEAHAVMSTIFYMAKEQTKTSYSLIERQDGMLRDRLPANVMGGRCSWTPNVNYGRELVIRLLFRQDWGNRKMSDLYLPEQARLLEEIRSHPNGMAVWSGPVGSGKSTSVLIYILEMLRACGYSKAAASIEDPVEYVVPGVRQQSMTNSSAGMTRKEQMIDALKGVLRQDKNILNIGETRDLDTAELAIHAARSGLFVLTTTHANGAHEIPLKMRAMGLPEADALDPSVFLGFVSQRLARRLCPKCRLPLVEAAKRDDRAARQLARMVVMLGERAARSLFTHRSEVPHDCPTCRGRSYSGRMTVGEIIAPNIDFMQRYVGAISPHAAREFWLGEMNGISMQAHGVALALQGLTSIDEVERILGPCKGDRAIARLAEQANDLAGADVIPLSAGR